MAGCAIGRANHGSTGGRDRAELSQQTQAQLYGWLSVELRKHPSHPLAPAVCHGEAQAGQRVLVPLGNEGLSALSVSCGCATKRAGRGERISQRAGRPFSIFGTSSFLITEHRTRVLILLRIGTNLHKCTLHR